MQVEKNVASFKEQVLRTQARAERAGALEREHIELDVQSKTLARDIEDLERSREAAQKDKTDAKSVRERMRAEHNAQEQTAFAAVRALQREMDAITVQTDAIRGYIEAGKELQLQKAQEAVTHSRQRLDENEALVQRLETKLRELDDQLRNHDAHKRLLDDNVTYRQNVMAEQRLRAEIEAKQGVHEALGNHATMRVELGRLVEEAQAFRNEQNISRGRMAAHKEQVDKCRRELKDAAFKDIDEKYRIATIELRTTEMANDDLNKYHAALDKALMAFHASKMAEINRVVKELWQKTYRGQDIENIAICSDAEATTGRSYNYRVVMKSGDAELDMRGRCSAGQKVLACLIIRLALAETFCLNCGILALDEPTTNLDAPNSTSLAQALSDIMQSRRDQENFQLIVITHDVRFAHLIGQREHAEYYWRISKDEDLHSHIEKARRAAFPRARVASFVCGATTEVSLSVSRRRTSWSEAAGRSRPPALALLKPCAAMRTPPYECSGALSAASRVLTGCTRTRPPPCTAEPHVQGPFTPVCTPHARAAVYIAREQAGHVRRPACVYEHVCAQRKTGVTRACRCASASRYGALCRCRCPAFQQCWPHGVHVGRSRCTRSRRRYWLVSRCFPFQKHSPGAHLQGSPPRWFTSCVPALSLGAPHTGREADRRRDLWRQKRQRSKQV